MVWAAETALLWQEGTVGGGEGGWKGKNGWGQLMEGRRRTSGPSRRTRGADAAGTRGGGSTEGAGVWWRLGRCRSTRSADVVTSVGEIERGGWNWGHDCPR